LELELLADLLLKIKDVTSAAYLSGFVFLYSIRNILRKPQLWRHILDKGLFGDLLLFRILADGLILLLLRGG
jgi:hypothetical protein